jgi:hypothetical protein
MRHYQQELLPTYDRGPSYQTVTAYGQCLLWRSPPIMGEARRGPKRSIFMRGGGRRSGDMRRRAFTAPDSAHFESALAPVCIWAVAVITAFHRMIGIHGGSLVEGS